MEDDAAFVGVDSSRREGPGIAVDVAQSELGESELLDDAGVTNHDVRRRTAVDTVAGKAFHRRDRAARDGVALENLHRHTGIGQITGRGQGIVAGAHHHSIDHAFRLLARREATGGPGLRRGVGHRRR